MGFLKALMLGAILSGVVSTVVGSTGSSGGQMAIRTLTISGYDMLWSWPVFLAGTGLAWGLILLQR